MNVELTTIAWGDYSLTQEVELYIDGVLTSYFTDGVPKQNTLRDNFHDVFKIPDLLRLAYDAGKNGQELTIFKRTYTPEEIKSK